MNTRWRVWVLAGTCLLLFPPFPALAEPAGEGAIRESVVKVFATMRFPDLVHPWTKQSPREASGTGVVIEGKRILTNAHVAMYASQLFVQSNQSDHKEEATVEALSPEMDLAILKLEDESFFEGRPPLKRVVALPEIKESVVVYGYPQGGESLSVTKGVVSRIEFTHYNDGAMGLRIQIDAAINPGNSGGPALVNDALIGLTFSRLDRSDNIGYIIPTEEIELFLKDVADGHYDGKPLMYSEFYTLENEALRGRLKLDKKVTGVVYRKSIHPVESFPLKEWDVIAKIGDHAIDNSGMIQIKEDLRLAFVYAIQQEVKEGKVPLTVIRDGEERSIDLPVAPWHDALIPSLRGRYPSYFIYGPLVFSPASGEMVAGLEAAPAQFFSLLARSESPLVLRKSDRRRSEGEELVVIVAPLFPHRISRGYSSPQFHVVQDVNGIPIRNLRHLVETLRDLEGPYVTFRFYGWGAESLVFQRQEVPQATDEILSENGILRQASDDVAEVWTKGR